MLERFHVQFEWRFGLKRLLVVVVFLGLFVGLNLRKIEFSTTNLAGYGNAWGWPFPFIAYTDDDDDWIRTYPAHYDEVPWTHTTYRMLQLEHFRPLKTQSGLVICAIVDVLFALTVLLGVLFLRIPRRKPSS